MAVKRFVEHDKLSIVRLNGENFDKNSLDSFVVRQRVTQCWRKVNGKYALAPVDYIEEWSLTERQNKAKRVVEAVKNGSAAFAAVENGEIIGFALLINELFGKSRQYMELAELYVAEPCRRRGTGRLLFEKVCEAAKKAGAEKLYISAHSAKESIAAYTKYGCVFAEEPSCARVEKEPFDLQLEYDLRLRIYVADDKRKFMDLLLLADEQADMVERYLHKGTMFVLDECGVKGEIIVTNEGNGVLEIKSLAILPEFRRRGYGRALIEFICERYKDGFDTVQVGTGDSPLTIPFYISCGFTPSHRVKDFFTENYDHPIIEAGVILKDMIYLTRKLHATKYLQ